jgi:hypothetical protein
MAQIAAMFQTHPQLSGIIMRLFGLVGCAGLPHSAAHGLLNFLRRYSDGRQPIHFVNAFEKTNGFW